MDNKRFIIYLLVVCIGLMVCALFITEPVKPEQEPIEIYEVVEISEVEDTPFIVIEENIEEDNAFEEFAVEKHDTTTFRVTAYCACKKCCGKWADKRPLDKNGEPIVYGASGEVLISGFSCASPLEFGTQIELDGIGTVEVQDRTANWVVDKYGENIIDIYMNNHELARSFGLQYVEGVIK